MGLDEIYNEYIKLYPNKEIERESIRPHIHRNKIFDRLVVVENTL